MRAASSTLVCILSSVQRSERADRVAALVRSFALSTTPLTALAISDQFANPEATARRCCAVWRGMPSCRARRLASRRSRASFDADGVLIVIAGRPGVCLNLNAPTHRAATHSRLHLTSSSRPLVSALPRGRAGLRIGPLESLPRRTGHCTEDKPDLCQPRGPRLGRSLQEVARGQLWNSP